MRCVRAWVGVFSGMRAVLCCAALCVRVHECVQVCVCACVCVHMNTQPCTHASARSSCQSFCMQVHARAACMPALLRKHHLLAAVVPEAWPRMARRRERTTRGPVLSGSSSSSDSMAISTPIWTCAAGDMHVFVCVRVRVRGCVCVYLCLWCVCARMCVGMCACVCARACMHGCVCVHRVCAVCLVGS